MQNAFDPEVRESRARLLAVRLLRSHADHGQLPAFGLYTLVCDTLFPLGCWSVPACTRVRPTGLYGHQKVGRMHISLLRGARSLLSGLSVVAPSEVWISCDTMRDADKWYCSLGVLALNVVSWIFHVSSPVRACAILFASEHHSICSLHTAILDEWSGPVGVVFSP